MSDDHLKSYVERIQRLTEERKTIADDIGEVYAEAKANGYDRAAIKWVVSELEKDPDERAERDAIRDLYMQAVTGSSRARARAPARTREDRSRDRLSEAMDDTKELSAEMAKAGLITPEAHAENIALSDAAATKFGSGVLRPHCLNRQNCGSYGSKHCFRCREAAGLNEAV